MHQDTSPYASSRSARTGMHQHAPFLSMHQYAQTFNKIHKDFSSSCITGSSSGCSSNRSITIMGCKYTAMHQDLIGSGMALWCSTVRHCISICRFTSEVVTVDQNYSQQLLNSGAAEGGEVWSNNLQQCWRIVISILM